MFIHLPYPIPPALSFRLPVGAGSTPTRQAVRFGPIALYAVNLFRPFAFRRSRIFRPVLLLIRARKPTRRFWMSRLLRASVGRGPHRICAAPARAGCAEMEVLGTRSRGAPSSADVVFVVDGEKRASGGWDDRKTMVGGVEPGTVGRRLGREEKVLRQQSEQWRMQRQGPDAACASSHLVEPVLVALVVAICCVRKAPRRREGVLEEIIFSRGPVNQPLVE